MHVYHSSSLPALLPSAKQLNYVLKALLEACAAGSGHTALDHVRIPEGVTEVHPRTKRLVRQAQVSAW